MANWCCTDIVMEGAKENIQKLYEDLGQAKDDWLGRVAFDILGIDWNDIPCRGWMNGEPGLYIDEHIGHIRMIWITAWNPCYELQNKLADKYDLSVYFIANESELSIHETNDVEGKFFPCRYIWGSEEYECFEELAEDFVRIHGGEVKDFSHLKERLLVEEEEPDYKHMVEYTIVDNMGNIK